MLFVAAVFRLLRHLKSGVVTTLGGVKQVIPQLIGSCRFGGILTDIC